MGEIMENLTLTAALAKALGGGGGGGGGGVSDVRVNNVSVVEDGVANVPKASANNAGVVTANPDRGIEMMSDSSFLQISASQSVNIKPGGNRYKPLVPAVQHEAIFYGLAKAAGADMKDIESTTVGIYPEAQKSAISQMLSAPETVSGSTPSIVAKPGVQYICGEVSTIDITVPATGIIDVIFESGSTPTVLTVTPPTGMTMKWAGGFDPTSLEADTVYEINIAVAGSICMGVAGAWT